MFFQKKKSMNWKMNALGVIAFVGTLVFFYLWSAHGSLRFITGELIFLSLLFELGIISRAARGTSSLSLHLRRLLYVFVIGAILGLLYDLVGVRLFETWTYNEFLSPYHHPIRYALYGPFFWGIWFLIAHQIYEFVHSYLHKEVKLTRFTRTERIAGVVGLALVIVGLSTFDTTEYAFLPGTVFAVGLWLTLEGLSLPTKHPTLLTNILNKNFRPLLATLIGALVLGFISEYPNIVAPYPYWTYYGLPLPDFTFYDIQVTLLLAWVWLFIPLLSLENILIPRKFDIWR